MKLTGSGGQRENITDMGVGEVVPGVDVPEKKEPRRGKPGDSCRFKVCGWILVSCRGAK